ncbi:hypothetical protein M422DRAFT_253368 [Sphaerobolus stellatus SS14]|uniref:Uncharacterized protein n=1 Tax=Sphaerobolus stellatus (strain SS14) TaxID=990650 RepID=A0A0C9VND1_SPHS4|nr:hypothetical protein M422DRAFT_253368 [Sphaerobolus stellatus SS14]
MERTIVYEGETKEEESRSTLIRTFVLLAFLRYPFHHTASSVSVPLLCFVLNHAQREGRNNRHNLLSCEPNVERRTTWKTRASLLPKSKVALKDIQVADITNESLTF